MDTLDQAVDYMRHNNTPYWWVKSGNSKVADNTSEGDINESMNQFRKAMQFLPTGAYKLECSRNPRDRSGSYFFPFQKGQTTTANSMQPVQSTNAYGVADQVYNQIRKDIMFEQMFDKFGPLAEMVKDHDKRLEKLEKLLADEDEDGTPDILEMATKATEMGKAVKEMKGLFK